MATVVTKTIGPSGRDYTTFSLAEADVENIATTEFGSTDLVANDGAIVFEADAGTYTENVTFNSSLTTDATRNVTYKPAAGSEHGGSETSGVRLQPSLYASLPVYDPYTAFDGLVIFPITGTTPLAINNYAPGTSYKNLIFSTSDSYLGAGIRFHSYSVSADPVVVENCVIKKAYLPLHIYLTSSLNYPLEVNNCTATERPSSISYFILSEDSGVATVTANNNLCLFENSSSRFTLGQPINWLGTPSNFANRDVPAALQGSPYPITPTTSYSQALESGDYAVYMASTGALVDVSGNDVWQGGVGPSVSVDVPSTDILGNPRSGATCNPGAFELDGYVAPTVITKTIGSGKDYADFATAEAAVPTIVGNSDLTLANTAVVFEADAGAYNQGVFISGVTSDATRNVTYKPASGSEHGGVGGYSTPGVRLNWGGAYTLYINDSFTVIDGLVFTAGGSAHGIRVGPNINGTRIKNCIVETAAQQCVLFEANTGTVANPSVIENCVAEAASVGNIIYAVDNTTTEINLKVYNCTLIGYNAGQNCFRLEKGGSATLNAEIVNCFCIGPQDYLGNPTTLAGSNNFGSSVSPYELPASIRGSVYPTTNTTSYSQALEAGDYAVYMGATKALVDVSGNDVWQGGVGPASNSDVPTTDILGNPRSGSTANPGAFEFDGYVAPTVVTKTVGTGRDYATITLAEAAIDTIATTEFGGNSLTENNGAIVFEIDAGTYVENVVFSTTTYDDSDATRNVTWKCASDAFHNGISRSGVVLSTTTCVRGSDYHNTFSGIEFLFTTGGLSTYDGIGATFENCLFTMESGAGFGVFVTNNSFVNPARFKNCVTRAEGTPGGDRRGLVLSQNINSGRMELINCTGISQDPAFRPFWVQAFSGGIAQYHLVNCLSLCNFSLYDNGNSGVVITGSDNFGSTILPFPAAIQGSLYPITPSQAYDPGSGDFALYVGKNGALLDSPNNDVINLGVGPASNSDVPTTDLQGNTRSGTTCNPGAFEQLDSLITVTKTIGPGGDYTTFAAAEADTDNIATSEIGNANIFDYNGRIIFEASAGTYSETVAFASNLTTDPTRNVTYKATEGAEHGGSGDSGVILGNGAYYQTFSDDHMNIDNLNIRMTTQTPTYTVFLRDGVGISFTNCILYGNGNREILRAGLASNGDIGSSEYPAKFSNCVFHIGPDFTYTYGINMQTTTGRAVYAKFANCTWLSQKTTGVYYFTFAYKGANPLEVEFVNTLSLAYASLGLNGSPTITGSNNFGGDAYPFPVAIQGSPYPITASPSYSEALEAGNYAVYMGATGQLANVSGNDVWNKGVGPASNSDVPTTDITGATRSGTTCNPGAFERDGYAPPTVITRTIGSGKDYATFAAAKSDINNIIASATENYVSKNVAYDLAHANAAIVFEVDAGTYNENTDFHYSTGYNFDATRNLTYKAAAGSEHKGIPHAGVRIVGTGTNYVRTNFLKLQDLEFDGHQTNTQYGRKGIQLDRCIFSRNGIYALLMGGTATPNGTAAHPNVFRNCVIKNKQNYANQASTIYGTDTEHNVNFINCTWFGWHTNAGPAGSSTLNIKFVNSIIFSPSRALYDSNTDSINYSGEGNYGVASNPFPSALKGSQYPIVPLPYNWDTIKATGSEAAYGRGTGRLANIPGNNAWNAGVGPDSNSDVPSVDIAGEPRTGTTTNPGAFQVPLTIPTNKTVITKTIDPDGEGDYTTIIAAESAIHTICDDEIGHSDLYEANGQIDFTFLGGSSTAGQVTFNFDNNGNPDAANNSTITGPNNRITFKPFDISDRHFSDQDVFLYSNFMTLDGFIVTKSAGNALLIKDNCHGLEVKRSSFTSPTYAINGFSNGTGLSDYPVLIENCEMKTSDGTLNRSEGIVFGGAANVGDFYYKIINCQANDDQCTSNLNDGFIRAANSTNVELTAFNNLDLRHDGKALVFGTISDNLTLSGSNNVGRKHPFNFVTYGLGTVEGSATTDTSPTGTGPFIIYDASTNKLVDNLYTAGLNAGWKAGVGPEVYTFIPFVDIEGKSRVGLTSINPGAYEVDTSTYAPPAPPIPTPPDDSAVIDTGLDVVVTETLSPTPSLSESRSRHWITREGDVRAEIFKMTQAEHNISFVYKETLRAMLASFNDIGYINSENQFIDVKCIHANAERAVAKIFQDNNLILPILSIAQTTTDNDAQREKYESLLVHEKVWDEDKQRAIRVLSLAPRAVNIRYTLNIWGKYLADVDQLLEQIRLKFNPEMAVPTPMSTMTRARIDSEENSTNFEAPDKEDRLIKKTISITVRTYIPNPKFLITSTGKIEKYVGEIV